MFTEVNILDNKINVFHYNSFGKDMETGNEDDDKKWYHRRVNQALVL